MKIFRLSSFEKKNIFLFGICIFLLSLILPISYGDDAFHATASGNAFSHQIYQYMNVHGRLLTHVTAGVILRHRYTADLLQTLVALLFFLASWWAVNPQYAYEEKQKQKILLPLLWMSLILFFTQGMWVPIVQVIHFASYRLTLALVLLFLLPYLKYYGGSLEKPKWAYILIMGFLAGATHEQSVVVVPALLLMAGTMVLLKKEIPSWYWVGLVLFTMGIATVLLAPSTFSEEKIKNYGNAENWEFFGQTYNWLELGWKKYLFSLIKVLRLWVPYMLPFLCIFIFFFWKCLKKCSLFSLELLPSLFLLMLSQAIIVVMMFSPRFEVSSMSLGGDLIMIACISIISVYWKNIGFPKAQHYQKTILSIVYVIFAITWGIQIPYSIAYRKDYTRAMAQIHQACQEGKAEIALPRIPKQVIKTPFGNIRIIYPPPLQTLKKYHSYMDITVIIKD